MKDLEARIAITLVTIRVLKEDFKVWVADQKIPLDKRWEFFSKSPDWLKDNNSWIEHFDCLKQILEDEIYDGINKGEHLSTDRIIESIEDTIECYPDPKEEYSSAFSREDINNLKEEFLSKNLGSVCFDW